MKIGYKSLSDILKYSIRAAANLPMLGCWRWRFLKWGGITIRQSNSYKSPNIYIGSDVKFDSVFPEEIEIGNHVHITTGCLFLTHYMEINEDGHIRWHKGHITINDNSFIGARTIVTKPVTIGPNSVVAAGSVVTKDIPSGELWGGVPTRFIKKL